MRLVAYYRVSTDRQGRSGLGLEAQQRCVTDYVAAGRHRLLAAYTEIESGRKDHRPRLLEAIQYAKLTGSKLIIARLDRLTRNAKFLNQLRDSQVPFVACDLPNANEFTIAIMAALAQQESAHISQRTRAAMQVLRSRGVKFGGSPGRIPPEAALRGRLKGGATTAAKSRFYTDVLGPRIAALHAAGASLRAIARTLNAEEYRTLNAKDWGFRQVGRVLTRYQATRAGGPATPASRLAQ